MDVQQNTTALPGVVFRKSDNGLYYSGSMQALVATGLFKNEWFPGERGNAITVSRITGKRAFKTGFSPTEIERIVITRHDGSSKLFHAKACFVWDIVRKNYKLREIPEAKKKSMDLALTWINGLPTNEDEFKTYNIRYLEACNSIKDGGLVYSRGGYAMSKDTVDQYNAAISRLNDLIMNGSLMYSEDQHISARLRSSREAFDRHLAVYFPVTERDAQFDLFNAEVESRLDLPALTGNCEMLGNSQLLAA